LYGTVQKINISIRLGFNSVVIITQVQWVTRKINSTLCIYLYSLHVILTNQVCNIPSLTTATQAVSVLPELVVPTGRRTSYCPLSPAHMPERWIFPEITLASSIVRRRPQIFYMMYRTTAKYFPYKLNNYVLCFPILIPMSLGYVSVSGRQSKI